MYEEQFPISTVVLVVLIVNALLFGLIMLYVFVIRKKNKETEDDNATKEKRQFTDKQQRYIDSLRSPSNGIPYQGMYYISESTHMALAEFIEEVFSFDANSQENHFKVQFEEGRCAPQI